MSEQMIKRIITTEVKEVEGESRVLEFTGSDETKDRMDEVIQSSGWRLKNFKKNPVFLWAHDYRSPPIGKAIKVWVDKEVKALKFRIEFAGEDVGYPTNMPSAETVYKLYRGGFLRAVSVGFIPIESEEGEGADEDYGGPSKKPRQIYTKQELLELSAVPVPANPNALGDAYAAELINAKELKTVSEWIHTSELKGKKDESAAEEPAKAEPPESESDNPGPRELSQGELIDELDFIRTTIENCGLSVDARAAAWFVVRDIMRISGDDIPVDIVERIGAVLNKKNREKLTEIQQLAQEVLDSAEKADKEDEEDKAPPPKEEWTPDDTKDVVSKSIRKIQGKLSKED